MVDHRNMAKFGRLYCSVMLANLILKLGRHDSLEEKEFDLEFWDVDDWDEYILELKATRDMLFRKDASVFIPAPILEFDNADYNHDSQRILTLKDEEDNKSLESMDLFTSKFENILNMCYLHSALSFIRIDVEEVMNATKGTTLDVGDDEVLAM